MSVAAKKAGVSAACLRDRWKVKSAGPCCRWLSRPAARFVAPGERRCRSPSNRSRSQSQQKNRLDPRSRWLSGSDCYLERLSLPRCTHRIQTASQSVKSQPRTCCPGLATSRGTPVQLLPVPLCLCGSPSTRSASTRTLDTPRTLRTAQAWSRIRDTPGYSPRLPLCFQSTKGLSSRPQRGCHHSCH